MGHHGYNHDSCQAMAQGNVPESLGPHSLCEGEITIWITLLTGWLGFIGDDDCRIWCVTVWM